MLCLDGELAMSWDCDVEGGVDKEGWGCGAYTVSSRHDKARAAGDVARGQLH